MPCDPVIRLQILKSPQTYSLKCSCPDSIGNNSKIFIRYRLTVSEEKQLAYAIGFSPLSICFRQISSQSLSASVRCTTLVSSWI